MVTRKNISLLKKPLPLFFDYWSYCNLPVLDFLKNGDEFVSDPTYLMEELTVIEVLLLIFKSERLNFPVYINNEYSWEISLANIVAFLNERDEEELYYHKLNFNLRSVREALKLRRI